MNPIIGDRLVHVSLETIWELVQVFTVDEVTYCKFVLIDKGRAALYQDIGSSSILRLTELRHEVITSKWCYTPRSPFEVET